MIVAPSCQRQCCSQKHVFLDKSRIKIFIIPKIAFALIVESIIVDNTILSVTNLHGGASIITKS